MSDVPSQALERLRRALRLKGLVLFGSRSRGDWKPWSDYDLLIIAEFEEDYMSRIPRILELLSDIPAHVEPHPYTVEEARRMLAKGNPILVDALEEGKVLYTTPEFEELVETYRELKRRGLRRTETSIVLPGQQ